MSRNSSPSPGCTDHCGAAHRHARACHRLAQGYGGPRAGAVQHPPQALGAVFAVRLSLRAQCRRSAIRWTASSGPAANDNEGSTPALGDAQARRLLEAPAPDTLKGVRDRAILATLLYHGIRREELCLLRLRDMQSRQGVMHFRIKGKRDKIRFVPVHPMALRLIGEYLEMGKHGGGQVSMKAWMTPLPAGDEQPHRHAGHGTSIPAPSTATSVEIRAGDGHQRGSERALCAFAARDGRDERALK